MKRVFFHCAVPESWPTAARYPTRYTLIALLVAICLAALAAGFGEGVRFTRQLDSYATIFQSKYPEAPLIATRDGTLKATAAFKEPIYLPLPGQRLLIDPTGKTSPESIKEPTLLITSSQAISCGNDGSPWPMKLSYLTGMLSEKETPITADAIRHAAPTLGWMIGIGAAILLGLGNIAWAAAIMFLVCPLVMVVAAAGERPHVLPRRAAYRMCGALIIPLVLFGGLMQAAGYSITTFWGLDNALLFWFFAAGAMALWTGFMAKRMFAPEVNQPRGR